jgi:hypothetical protein
MRRLSVRRISVVVLLALLPLVSVIAQAPQKQEQQVVYVTKTGSKYHRESCRSLAKSKIEMALEKAAARYGACAICKPPVPAGKTATSTEAAAVPAATLTPAKPAATRPAAKSVRCQATTQKGTQCSRTAQTGRSYCWQHAG